MRMRRSGIRREFSVRTAGWFTVLKPDGWFPALHQHGRFHDRRSQSGGTAAADHADSREWMNSPQIMIPNTVERRVMRPALILLAAMMLTSGLLWWIMHP